MRTRATLTGRLAMIAGMAIVVAGCSFILSEDEEYRYRKIDYPVGEKQKIR